MRQFILTLIFLMSMFGLPAGAGERFFGEAPLPNKETVRPAEQQDAREAYKFALRIYSGVGFHEDKSVALKWFKLAAELGHADAQEQLGYMFKTGEGIEADHDEANKWYRKAFEQYKKAAELEDAEAYYRLGDMYDNGNGVPRDDAEKIHWFKLAAAQGHAEARRRLNRIDSSGHGVGDDETGEDEWFGQALEQYRKAAAQGDAKAQYRLGHMYYWGYRVPVDKAEADKWFKMAARHGDARAQYDLARKYHTGAGVRRNRMEALKWYRLAAGKGHAAAQEQLSNMFRSGDGIPADSEEAAKWYALAVEQLKKDAEQGNPDAQFRLGEKYRIEYYDGVTEAAKWYLMAAENGHGKAQEQLGHMFLSGQGVPRNNAEADKWFGLALEQYKTAAARGDVETQYRLGRAYYHDYLILGIPQDLVEGAKWFRMAAEQGHALAQSHLSDLYRSGAGVTMNIAEAEMWKNRAAVTAEQMAVEHKYADAPEKLEDIISYEKSTSADETEGEKWSKRAMEQYRKAVKLKDTLSLSRLAKAYYYEDTVVPDGTWYNTMMEGIGDEGRRSRVKRLRITLEQHITAAEQGDARARLFIGYVYLTSRFKSAVIAGAGVWSLEAYDWSTMVRHSIYEAARKGDTAACYQMANIYHNGFGVDAKSEISTGWLKKAGEQNLEAGKQELEEETREPDDGDISRSAMIRPGALIGIGLLIVLMV
ncbi:MAG: sel1 repeat family protein, partial [Methylobacteriaceae bacterium]|nr:sel1 repeat family protein [Methylobacteriaceae bacterium]